MNNLIYNKKPLEIDESTGIPVFQFQDENVNEFSIKNAAEIHDNALNWLFQTHGVNEDDLRKELVKKLDLKTGQKILITATGAGNDIPYIAKLIGETGEIYAQDFAKEMLFAAYNRTKEIVDLNKYKIFFSVNDATDLPFNDNTFDATYHFGGINLYNDIKKGIDEMNRVTKKGGKVVFGDEGVAYWLKKTELAESLITNNSLFKLDPPMDLLPINATKVNLSWVINNCFYLIDYVVGDDWNVNIDLNHVGKRGGTIRKRHYGKLEGIDPKLRDKFYKYAEKVKKSRVDLLEKIIEEEIKKND